ncbi:MAG TPA: PAS domain S-box protein [Mucilaginibacter sp.]|nr:PAS domain S-box protein [Mucilaginibacter sp.]
MTAGFVASMLLLVFLSVVSYQTISSSEQADDWVSHTLQVIVNTQRISAELIDAQYNKQLYTLTRNDNGLNEYNLAKQPVRRNIDSLRWLVRDNPPQVQRVDSLAKYANNELSRDTGSNKAPASVLLTRRNLNGGFDTNVGKCRSIITSIINTERTLLVSRKEFKNHQANSAKWLIVIDALISLVILGGLLIYIVRTFKIKQRLREQLQISESKFSKIFSDSGIGMAIVSLKGEWLEVNPYLLQMLGYTQEELSKKTFQEITYPNDLKKDMAFVAQLLRGEADTYKMEKRYYHKNGNIVWVLLTVSLIHYEDSTPRFFVSQIEDITATKKLIGQLEVKNESLSIMSADLKSKVNQLDEFNRIVAHNLRGPAGSIQMMLNMYKEETDEKEKGDLFELISKSSDTLMVTLQDLMQVLEIKLNQSIPYDNCDLAEVVEKTRAMLQGDIIRSQATISTDFWVQSIHFPRIYLESLFYNMLSNELKYKKNGEPVRIEISSAEDNGRVKLVFKDNGLGIDLQKHGKNMFKPNKVFHKGYDSKGVGLFITKNQLETYGASINVESEPGVGTTFTVYI